MDRRMSIVAGAALSLALASGVAGQDTLGIDDADWHAVVLPQTERIAALATGVAVGPEAIVAVGQRACEWRDRKTGDIGRCWGQPWISTDGITWEAVAARTSGLDLGRFVMATSGPEIGVEGVAHGPGGFVAYGWARPADALNARDGGIVPALWRSDDGRSWERVPTPETFSGDYLMLAGPWLSDIAGSPEGYLLAGVIYDTPAPVAAIWSSPDGLTWTLAEDDKAFDVGAYIDTMEVPAAGGVNAVAIPAGAADLAGAIAVGAACPAGESGAGPKAEVWHAWDWTTGRCRARAWRTEDGTTWEAHDIEATGVDSLPVEVQGASAVATNGERSVTGAYPGLLLYSKDASSWGIVGGRRVGRQVALSADPGGFHALVPGCANDKCRRRRLDLATSPDGVAWAFADAQPTMPAGVGDFLYVDMAPVGDRVVATAGYLASPSDGLAAMALLSPPLAAADAVDAAEATRREP